MAQTFDHEGKFEYAADAWKAAESAWKEYTQIPFVLQDSAGTAPSHPTRLSDSPDDPVVQALRKRTNYEYYETKIADDYITDSRLFLRSAGLAVRSGLDEAKALEALTLAGARMLDLEARVGSLEVGKDADFVVLDGPPLSVYTRVQETWVEGSKVFDRATDEDRLIAVGGYGAGSPHAPRCCGEEEDAP
jgi:hypothetical protein